MLTSPDPERLAEFAPLSPAEVLTLPEEWHFLHPRDQSALPTYDIAALLHNLQRIDQAAQAADADALALSQSDLIELATQTWRLDMRVQAMDSDADKRAVKQFSDSVRRFNKLLQRFSVEYVDPINMPYTSGWQEVEVINWDEPDDTPSPVAGGPWIKQTIAPIIRRKDRMIKAGQVVCVDVPDL
jgi:hypothetical protein